jgi:hypothetical protein
VRTLKYVGYFAAAAIAFTVAYNYGDIRRYIKIETM